MRPLDGIPSIKLKLGITIAVAVTVSTSVSVIGWRLGLPLWVRPPIAMAIALVLVQLLARGMTSPLREMADAAAAMARGEYGRRVTATSADEVGELARAFNAMAADLGEADRMRRDLVANVSHELRTPITALQAHLENLVDGVTEPDPETLRTMLTQTERLGRLVHQLLDLSRLESGTVPMEVCTLALSPLLEDVAREARLNTKVPVVVAAGGAALVVRADAEKLHQVMANLVENAVRHSPVTGTVRLSARRQPHGPVTLEVSDDGPGIPEGEQERVFERFYRADSSRSADRGGAGLGLAISSWIVDLHGGRIRAERNHPTGCRMVVELPAAPA